ncbi:MAG: glycosyltransferase [Bacteroidota bacterium]
MSKTKKRILVCPLDWGLGHATRCIPVIKELINSEVEVVIGADKRPLALLKKEFPQLEFIKFPGYSISYPSNSSMERKMMMSLPKIFHGIYKEHTLLKSIIKKYNIDAVISDNRFGLWNKTVHSVFITHQVMVKCPENLKFLEPILHRISRFFINKYNECWVPDFQGSENLSGDLAHGYPLPDNAFYIGPLSRFDFFDNNLDKNPPSLKGQDLSMGNYKYDLMVIVSGPEPQRSIFEIIVMKQLESASLKVLMVRGVTEESNSPPPAPPEGRGVPPLKASTASAEKKSEGEEVPERKNPTFTSTQGGSEWARGAGIEIYHHLETSKMREAILSSKLVLSRPGYSTIMDLAVLGKKAIFVPTPGQTEQEYLADLLHEKGIFYMISQERFSARDGLKNAMERSAGFNGMADMRKSLYGHPSIHGRQQTELNLILRERVRHIIKVCI